MRRRAPRTARLASALALAATLVAFASVAQAQSASGAPLTVSASATIDGTTQFWGVSCPSDSLCVASDGAGQILTSTNPAAGTWGSPVAIDDPNSIFSLSCPSTTLCVAIDGVGNVLTSINPTGGASAWSQPEQIDVGIGLAAISCPSTSLCVAVDFAGNVLTSTNPTGGAAAWSSAAVEPGIPIDGVSCPTSSLCVAVDVVGNVLTATAPTGGVGAWSSANVDQSTPLAAVSCTTSFCAAVDDFGNVAESSDPTGGLNAWTVSDIDGTTTFDAVSCVLQYCEAVDQAGVILEKAPAPWGATNDGWDVLDTEPQALFGVSCPSTGLCVDVGDQGLETVATGAKLSVAFAGTGGGTISDAGAPFSCSSACGAWYASGASATVAATPASGSTFDGWGSGCPGTVSGITCQVSMTSSQSLSASFTLANPKRGGTGSGGSGSGGGGQTGSGPPGRAPKTKILGAVINPRRGSATFRFAAKGSHSGFQCALVRRSGGRKSTARHYVACRSPRSYRDLRGGRYGFFVRATKHGGTHGAATRRAFTIR
jgi:Divergent InlB B-repeat domain